MKKLLIAAIVGALLGIVGSRFIFVGSALNLIPWGLVGLATGVTSKDQHEALVNGAIYGFILSFIFMLSGYNGTAPVITRIIPFALLGLFGAVCGIILGFIGYFMKSKLENK